MKADKLGDCASVAIELPSGHFEGPIKKKHLSWKIINSKDGPGPKEIIEGTNFISVSLQLQKLYLRYPCR